jgi:GAF domain-containing protein/HAMP domain-containing protein
MSDHKDIQADVAEASRMSGAGTLTGKFGPSPFMLRLVIRILGLAILLRFGTALLGYLMLDAWQLLVLAGIALGVGAGLVWALRLAKRGRDQVATVVLVIFLLVGALSQLFFLQDMSLYVVAGSVMLLAVVGTFSVKEGWRLSVIAVGVLIAAALIVANVGLPWARYGVSSRLMALIYVAPVGMAFLLLLIAVTNAQVLRSGSIRIRLLFAFVLIAALPGLLISFASVYFSTRSATSRLSDSLMEEARLRETQIERWVRDRRLDLATFRDLELSNLRSLLETDPNSQVFRYAYALQKNRFQSMLGLRDDLDVLFLIDAQGSVILSTDLLDEMNLLTGKNYLVEGLKGSYVSPVQTSELLDDLAVTTALPILNGAGEPIGVLAGQSRLDHVRQEAVMDRIGLDPATEIYLVDADGRLLTDVAFPGLGVPDGDAGDDITVMSPLASEGIDQVLSTRADGIAFYDNYRGTRVLGAYRWIPELEVAMLVELDRSAVFRSTMTMILSTLGATLFSTVVAGVVAFLMTRDIARPLIQVAEAASRIADGTLERTVPVVRNDEIGRMAQVFNRMTERLRETINSLEERVAARTADLERRSTQLETAALVSRQAASIRDVDRLLDEVAQEIAERFGFYHVGIYLLDESGREALLRASSPGGGEQLLARGFAVEVGATGIIGDVAATGRPGIALDVTSDMRYVAVSELSETRSEISLPLRARDALIGVLDVQSRDVAFFSEEDVAYLQIMADQIALAIDNARLFSEAEQRLLEIGRLVQGQQYEGWRRLVSQRPHWAYLYNGLEILEQNQTDLHVSDPDMTFYLGDREQPIGTIKVAAKGGAEYSSSQVELARAIAEESGRALERARLFSNTQEALLEAGILYRGSRAIAEADSIQGVLSALVDQLVTEQVDLCALLLHETHTAVNRDWLRVAAFWQRTDGARQADVGGGHVVGRGWHPEHFPGLMQIQTEAAVFAGAGADVDDAVEDGRQALARVLRETFDLRSTLVIPIAAGRTRTDGQELLGWLLVGSTETIYDFNELELRLYQGLVGQVATMVRNFQLLALATDQAERERIISTMGAQIRSSTDVETILRTSVRELGRMLKATEGVIRLESRDPERGNDQESAGLDETVVVEGG